jgi:hypothetical protein
LVCIGDEIIEPHGRLGRRDRPIVAGPGGSLTDYHHLKTLCTTGAVRQMRPNGEESVTHLMGSEAVKSARKR